MLKIRRPLGRLIFNMGIAIPGKTVFLIETAPWRLTVPYREISKPRDLLLQWLYRSEIWQSSRHNLLTSILYIKLSCLGPAAVSSIALKWLVPTSSNLLQFPCSVFINYCAYAEAKSGFRVNTSSCDQRVRNGDGMPYSCEKMDIDSQPNPRKKKTTKAVLHEVLTSIPMPLLPNATPSQSCTQCFASPSANLLLFHRTAPGQGICL